MSVTLKDVGSGFKRTAINQNFTDIESEINNNLLNKDGSTALESDLDFNSNRLLNASAVYSQALYLNGKLLTTDGLSSVDALNIFSTVSELKAAPGLLAGTTVQTQGYYSAGDGGGATYLVAAPQAVDGYGDHTLANSNVALIQYDDVARTKQYGAKADSSTNDTSALLAFFNACINNGVSGVITSGTYVVDLGVLAFDNGHVDTPFPKIETDGYESVTFKASSNIDSPFISITNGTASSGVGNFWKGGGIGGISFEPASAATSGLTNMNGLVLRGCENMDFGFMRGTDLGGSTIEIPQLLFGGSNPDPYHVSSVNFDGAEGVRNNGKVFNNNNYVGLAGCTIGRIRAIENVGGVYFGLGAANTVGIMSCGSNGGWSIGDQSDVTGGASTRFMLGTAEFDDSENGIDTTIASNCDFGTVRFVHRYNFSSLNPSGGYWPRTALKIGNPARSVSMLNFNVIDRIESGGAKIDMGEFADFVNASGNLNDVIIRRQVLDNASFGFDLTDYYTNFSSNSSVEYFVGKDSVLDSRTSLDSYLFARNSGTVAVPNGGFTGGSNYVAYDTVVQGASGNYDTGTYTYTVPSDGLYHIKATLFLSLTAGNRVRMSIFRNGANIISSYKHAPATAAELYEIEITYILSAGDTIQINADQNSGAGVTTGGGLSANDSHLAIRKIR